MSPSAPKLPVPPRGAAAALALVLCAAVVHAGDVHPVPADAGTADVAALIAAAADGDILLFEPGATVPYVEIDGKALALVGDGEPLPQINLLEIRNVSGGLPVIVRNLWVRGSEPFAPGPSNTHALVVQDCAAAVLIEDCQLTLGIETESPASLGGAALYAENAASVSVNRCTLQGVTGYSTLCGAFGGSNPGGPGGPALEALDARVFVSASLLTGGVGGASQLCDGGPGAPGVSADADSHVVLHGSAVTGGNGGGGALSNNGVAATGLLLASGGAAWLVDTDPQAGTSGFGAEPPDIVAPGGGVVDFVNTTARALSVTGPLREGEAGAIEISGRQGDWIAIFWSFQADWQPFFFYKGALLPSEPLFGPIILGPNPQPDGVTWSVPIVGPDMPAGLDGQFALMQALVQDPDSFQLVFTAATNYILLSDDF